MSLIYFLFYSLKLNCVSSQIDIIQLYQSPIISIDITIIFAHFVGLSIFDNIPNISVITRSSESDGRANDTKHSLFVTNHNCNG